jgi:hypothetical protein
LFLLLQLDQVQESRKRRTETTKSFNAHAKLAEKVKIEISTAQKVVGLTDLMEVSEAFIACRKIETQQSTDN